MNGNDFVVIQSNKATSVKRNARNLQDLQMEKKTLAQESDGMEEKLQQLRERMNKEKEERGNSGRAKWKSGQCGSLNSNVLTNNTAKIMDKTLQKLSEGKLKVRVLKKEPLTVPPQPPPPPPPSTIGLQTTRKNRLKGKCCGQCEVKTAGLMCAECTEHYCIGCFTRFHQKGALKLHRIIPVQMDLKTHVSTQDVVSFQNSCRGTSTSPNPSPKSKPGPDHTSRSDELPTQGDQCPGKEAEAEEKPVQSRHESSQVLVIHRNEKKKGMMEETPKNNHEKGFSSSLLRGEYNEEESAKSFQEALRQWRGERSKEAMFTPIQPVSVSAMATQTDLVSDRGAEVRGRGVGAVKVEFTENSLTYMDRLLLKKHHSTPIETSHPSWTSGTDLKSLPDTEEATSHSLTAEEEDFRLYFASLFAGPVSRSRTEPQTTTPEPSLIIEILDERDADGDGLPVPEQRTDNNKKCPSGQQILNNGRKVYQTALTSASSSKTKPSARSTAETPRASKKSIKTPTSKSQQPHRSPTVHKSKPDCGSPQLLSSVSLPNCQTALPKSSPSAPSGVSPLATATPPISEEPVSHSPSTFIPLRSTFTLSPSSSTESALLPKVDQSTPLQQGSQSSLLLEAQSPQLFSQRISSVRLSQSPPSNLQFQRQSQHFLCYPECPLSHNQPHGPQKPSQPVRTPPGADLRHSSTPTNKGAPVLTPFTFIDGYHNYPASQQDTRFFPSVPPCHYVSQDSPSALETEPSTDSEGEMSSDSLGLAPHEEDSSDDETQISRRLMRGAAREEERGDPAISHPDDSLVAAGREKELQTDGRRKLSEPAMVIHRQSVGSGSERSCDLDEFLPLGLDLYSGHSNTVENTPADSLHKSRTSPNESELTGSDDFETRISLSPLTEEHLAISLMKDNHKQPTGIKIHSTTPTVKAEISVPGTSGN
ncbi:mucin-17 isoform X2 [Cheilinus undulatus]|nr:mucin-17 isoform X2 [Cheilinus undulatus]